MKTRLEHLVHALTGVWGPVIRFSIQTFSLIRKGGEDLGLTLAELFASLFLSITQQRLWLDLREEGVREEKRRAKL